MEAITSEHETKTELQSTDVNMKTNTKLLMSAALLTTAISSFAQPLFTTQPADQTANQGFSASFGAIATIASPPLAYQWYFNSNAIPWAITNTLTITNVHPTNAGGYFAVATDATGAATSHVATLTVVLPAALDPKLSANIRLGDDSPLLPGRNQGEVHIARSYADPNLIVAAFQDGIGSVHAAAPVCSYAASADGGLTWTGAFIPGLTTTSGGQNAIAGDNVAATDVQGNLAVGYFQYQSGFNLSKMSPLLFVGVVFS